jgi:poly(3-hydroxyalkanoate) depolymerase
MHSITVGGQRLRVCVRDSDTAGDGAAGVPLLLVNGIGAGLELLQPFVDQLSPSLEVIRFDVPGVGGSPLPSLPYSFTGLCRLMAGLLTALGHEQADVLGISWGGGVAQHFAAFRGSRCRRLVLVSTATGALMVPARPAVLRHMLTPRRYLDQDYLRSVAPVIYGGSARGCPDKVSSLLHDQGPASSPYGYLYQLAAIAGWTSLPFLPLIRQPALILSGDDDPLIPLANARLMNALIPRSRLHVYHGGHLDLITEAAELAPVVSRFLENQPG